MGNKIIINKPDDSEMCPVGEHVVRGHTRHCEKSDTWVDTHFRKNRGRKKMYLSENLLYIFWKNKRSYSQLNTIYGFSPYNEIDDLIQFWFEYWKQQGSGFPDDLTPLHIKALIAVESSFNPNAKAKTTTAIGLMQVLKTALSALRGTKNLRDNEVKDNYISVTTEQLTDPVVNIAVGTRWLAHKYFLLRNHKNKSVKEVIRDYHSRDKVGEEYAERILNLYKKSK
jgi:hypothetical protein